MWTASLENEKKWKLVCARLSPSDLGCTLAKWNNTIEYNVAQIKAGQLHVADNTYREGGSPVRIVSTSQLEGFHSALKKLLAREVRSELGLRILDVFIVQHNIDVGARFGRNPPISNVDLISACRAATLCKLYGKGLVASTPEQEFITNLVSESIPAPQYRSATGRDFSFQAWEQMFKNANVDASEEVKFINSRQHMKTIRELLCKKATVLETGKVDSDDFMHSLRMEENNSEGANALSIEEHELLRQVVREQVACKRVCSDCDLVTTIMYNLVVASNRNSFIKIQRRSYRTLESKIKKFRTELATPSLVAYTKKLFEFRTQQQCKGRLTTCEHEIQSALFTTLRESYASCQKRKIFCKIYDFAACICDGVRAFSKESLLRRWEVLKKSPSTNGEFKIKFKITRRLLPLVDSTETEANANSSDAPAISTSSEKSFSAAPPLVADTATQYSLQIDDRELSQQKHSIHTRSPHRL
ncbi:Hypothetical protein PHPALM_13519 [Phytophthora palmivora]|uniref:Uncharacterized protein n=1 Tax=Phytophthora palmivora TaxID=4796 RepID=A0A2P4XXB3_9STRA|nr:Hypothetical protein PHPALM_13519 [Phytophthora palmivora]